MTNRVGLWIDHKQAVIVLMEDKGTITRRIESGAKHIVYRGAPRAKTAYSAQYSQGDDQLDKQYQQHLNRYYEQVITSLRGASSILIFGPGEAKSELKKRIDREKSLSRDITIESADRMTDPQIVARVRKHFQKTGS